MEKIITKWYCKDLYSDSIKMQVIKDFGDGTSLCQPLFRRTNGDEISVGEKMVINNSLLFDEPLQLIRLKKDDEEIKKEKEKLKKDLDQERQKIKAQCGRLDGRVKWLKRVEKEAHPEAIKQMIHFMYCLIEAKDLYLFQPCWGGFEVCRFNILEEQNPFFSNERNTSEFRLLSLYPGNEYPLQKGVEWCLAEYSDGSGDHYPIKIFDDADKLREYVSQYVNALKEINADVIKECAKVGIQIPKEKVLQYYKIQIEDNEVDIKRHSDHIAKCEKSKAELIEKINQLTNQEEQK